MTFQDLEQINSYRVLNFLCFEVLTTQAYNSIRERIALKIRGSTVFIFITTYIYYYYYGLIHLLNVLRLY